MKLAKEIEPEMVLDSRPLEFPDAGSPLVIGLSVGLAAVLCMLVIGVMGFFVLKRRSGAATQPANINQTHKKKIVTLTRQVSYFSYFVRLLPLLT